MSYFVQCSIHDTICMVSNQMQLPLCQLLTPVHYESNKIIPDSKLIGLVRNIIRSQITLNKFSLNKLSFSLPLSLL